MAQKTSLYADLRSSRVIGWLANAVKRLTPQDMVLIALVAGYFLIFPFMYEGMGTIAGTFVSIPVVAFAYLKGLRVGFISWLLLGIMSNTLLLSLSGSETPLFTQGQVSGQTILFLVTIIIGRMCDVTHEAIQRAELKLQKAVGELENVNRAFKTDTTAYETAIAKLQAKLDQQEQSLAIKSRMGMMTSHEFRTPLSLILSASEILRYSFDQLSGEQKERYFDIIHKQVDQLTSLSEDILGSGEVETHLGASDDHLLNIESACREIIATFQIAHPSSHHFRFEVLGSPRDVALDRKFVDRVIPNLLSNAAKYSPNGGEIALTLFFRVNGLSFCVKDQGVGIPEEDSEHLFDLFHRGRNAAIAPGTGLGLVIVKQAVEGHGGTIQVDSKIGVGTTFTINLPK